jgi:hypothetical protein
MVEYSSEGMKCPYCKYITSPVSTEDYNEYGFDLKCDECEKTFYVMPSCSWTWITKEKQ